MIDHTSSTPRYYSLNWTGSLKACTLHRFINFLNVSPGIFVIRREVGRNESNIKDESRFIEYCFSLAFPEGHL